MSTLAIIACVVGAVAALGLVYVASMDIYLTGFPDAHFTDYDKVADAPKRILVWVEWGFVLLFLVLAVLPISARRRAVGMFVALVALALIAIVQWVGIPWYFSPISVSTNGIGG
jgi:cell division protein FtsW (lipid II flippase)